MRSVRVVLLVSGALALSSVPAAAQYRSPRGGDLLVGVQGGATVGDFGGQSFINYSSRWGGTAGAFAAFRTSRNTLVGLEANWIQKGAESTRLDYLNVPLTVGAVAPLADGRGRGRFYTGIEMGIKLGCSRTESTATQYVPSCDYARDIEWSWPVGMQFAWMTSTNGFIGLDVRYSIGLSDSFDTSSIYSRSWQFRILYGWEPGSGR